MQQSHNRRSDNIKNPLSLRFTNVETIAARLCTLQQTKFAKNTHTHTTFMRLPSVRISARFIIYVFYRYNLSVLFVVKCQFISNLAVSSRK